KGKALRIIDTPPDPLFERIYIDGTTVSILPIPDPPPEFYEDNNGAARKPNVRDYAEYLDINPSYEIETSTRREHPTEIQSLHYPEDLEALLRKLDQSARTALEESGTNMLYLAFGYLGWYESQDS